jgi:hypothetical protein
MAWSPKWYYWEVVETFRDGVHWEVLRLVGVRLGL